MALFPFPSAVAMNRSSTNQEFLDEFGQLNDNDRSAQDSFFSNPRHFPGNVATQTHAPYERFYFYETRLKLLKEQYPDKYKVVHKGTPFYHLSWAAFDYGDYERAFFYMDAAISEDIINTSLAGSAPEDWHTSPSAQLIFLDMKNRRASGYRITAKAYGQLSSEIELFNNAFGVSLSVEDLVNRFIKKGINDPAHRSIVTSFHSFVLEFEDRITLLKLRSSGGGSIEPFQVHLLKGCLLFESILKEAYPSQKDNPLAAILNAVAGDLCYRCALISESAKLRNSLKDIVEQMVPFLNGKSVYDRAITLTYALRNTTAHSLLNADVFEQHYADLYRAVLSAMLYVINKKY